MASVTITREEWWQAFEIADIRSKSRRTTKRRAIAEMLRDGENWTDSAVARRVRCSVNYVHHVRSLLGLDGQLHRRSDRPGKGMVPTSGVVDVEKFRPGKRAAAAPSGFWLRCPHCNRVFLEQDAGMVT